jgi:hypothetical protein
LTCFLYLLSSDMAHNLCKNFFNWLHLSFPLFWIFPTFYVASHDIYIYIYCHEKFSVVKVQYIYIYTHIHIHTHTHTQDTTEVIQKWSFNGGRC